MATIANASEIKPKRCVSVLIYGQPSVGKTTLGCSAKDSVLFDYDGGVHRINPAHLVPTLQVESWEDTSNALEQLDNNPMYSGIRTIVIDTVGKMLDYMSEYIMRSNPKMKNYDETLSLKGYGQRKKMFADFVHLLAVKGKNVVFVAHEKEEQDGDEKKKRPLVGGSSASDLLQELDLVGYMQYQGNKRTLSFNATGSYYAKNSCYLPDTEIPVVVDAQGNPTNQNNFMENVVFEAFRAAQARRVELAKQYQSILLDIDDIIAGIDSIEALNDAAKTLAGKTYIYDAKIKAGMALNAKAKAMGAKYDKDAKCYVA